MTTTTACRRRQRRFGFAEALAARIEFSYPYLGGETVHYPLNDISGSGLSFLMEQSLPYLDVGDSLRGTEISIGGSTIPGDLLVMHLTERSSLGLVCGGLFFPHYDRGILELQSTLASLESGFEAAG